MSEQIALALNSLSDAARQEAYDFIMFLCYKEKNGMKEKVLDNSERVLAAFDEAKVCVPITWTREEINERA